jgi:hypothetical protein
MFGESFDVTMNVKNNAADDRTVHVTLTATVISYTGVPQNVIKSQTSTIVMATGKDGFVSMVVGVDEYLDKLVEMCHIKISCMCRVEATNEFYCRSDDFCLLKPHIDIKIPNECEINKEIEVEACFLNPLPRCLTKCEFSIQAALLQRPLTIKQGDIPVGGNGKLLLKLPAKALGDKEIIVSFESKELSALSGTARTKVVTTQTKVIDFKQQETQ